MKNRIGEPFLVTILRGIPTPAGAPFLVIDLAFFFFMYCMFLAGPLATAIILSFFSTLIMVVASIGLYVAGVDSVGSPIDSTDKSQESAYVCL